MNILITGITGFVGSHLAEYLVSLGHKVYGLIRWRSDKSNLKNVIKEVTLMEGDLTDLPSLREVLNKIDNLKQVYHLGAQSFVQSSFDSPIATLNANVMGTCNLLEAIYKQANINDEYPKILMCSSSEVYGDVPKEEMPTNETALLRPVSPYAVSKASADLLCYQYFQTNDLPIIRTRAFTHTGARRGDVFFASSFAKQIVAIELGLNDKRVIRCGNLESVRTICDVKDIVKGYWLALEKGVPGEVYNIGGDKQYSIVNVLGRLLWLSQMKYIDSECDTSYHPFKINTWHDIEIYGLDTVEYEKITIEQDPELMRPSDVLLQVPDTTKFRKQTGWKPEIEIGETLDSLLNYWREELKINPWKAY